MSYAFTMESAVSIITHIFISLLLIYFSHSCISLASLTFGTNIASGEQFSKIFKSFCPSSESKLFILITCSLFLFTPEFKISIMAFLASSFALNATESSKS